MKTLNPLTKSRQSISPHSRAIPVVHWNSFSLKSNYIDSISPLNRILAWRQWNSNVTGFQADSWKCLAQWFWDMFWALFEMVGNMLVCPCGEPDPEELKSLFFPPLFKRPPQLPGAQDGSSQYPSPYHWCYCIMQGNLNEQMFTAQSILPFNFAHLWWWEYLNIQTENTYGCLPVSTIFLRPPLKL